MHAWYDKGNPNARHGPLLCMMTWIQGFMHGKWNQLQRSNLFFMMVRNTIFEINSQTTIHGA